MIEAREISYTIGRKKLLHRVSFNVQPGELLAIVGANGAGKSTLLKILCKEIKCSSGEVLIRKTPIQNYSLPALAKFRSVLAQSNVLSVSFRVQELIMMGRYPHFNKHPSPEDHTIVKAVMEETGVSSFADRNYNTLSGGEQQRVQLARVLAQIYNQPKGILFLDEPTNGLDILYQQQILVLARNLADRGYCVVTILHDINYASRFAHKVLMLKHGERIAFGKPQDVINCENIHRAFNIHVKLFNDEEFKCPFILPAMNAKTK